MRTARRIAALAILAATLPAAAAQAAATPGVETRHFRFELKGTQTTRWSQHYEPLGQCVQGVLGTGSETATFRSRRS